MSTTLEGWVNHEGTSYSLGVDFGAVATEAQKMAYIQTWQRALTRTLYGCGAISAETAGITIPDDVTEDEFRKQVLNRTAE